MRVGKVIGTVTCSQLHPSLIGGQLKLVIPFRLSDWIDDNECSNSVDINTADSNLSMMERLRAGTPQGAGTELVAYDELSAGIGEWIALSEGAEASMPFYPNNKCVDAYAAAIIDTVEIEPGVLPRVK